MRLIVSVAVVAMAACGVKSPTVATGPPPPTLAAPEPLPPLEPVFMAPPLPTPPACSDPRRAIRIVVEETGGPEGWRTFTVRLEWPGGAVVTPECRATALGGPGPRWFGNVSREPDPASYPAGGEAHVSPSDPYVFLIRPTTRGTIMACAWPNEDGTDGRCGKEPIT